MYSARGGGEGGVTDGRRGEGGGKEARQKLLARSVGKPFPPAHSAHIAWRARLVPSFHVCFYLGRYAGRLQVNVSAIVYVSCGFGFGQAWASKGLWFELENRSSQIKSQHR